MAQLQLPKGSEHVRMYGIFYLFWLLMFDVQPAHRNLKSIWRIELNQSNRIESTSPLEVLCSATTNISAVHFIFGCSLYLTKWCHGSQGKFSFLRNWRSHWISLVELFVFNIAGKFSNFHIFHFKIFLNYNKSAVMSHTLKKKWKKKKNWKKKSDSNSTLHFF